MKNSAWRPLFLGLGLLAFGFLTGYGFQSRKPEPTPVPTSSPTPSSTPQAPLVKGLHDSPDGKMLAFTGVFDDSSRAATFLFNLQTNKETYREAPLGWQDYVTQWSADGRSLLVEREKIPRPVAEAKAGLYRAPLQNGAFASEPEALTKGLAPPNEKIIAGFWAPDGNLVVKTRREPKALYLAQNGALSLVDRAPVTYHQNRAILEGKNLVFYAVRDVAGQEGRVALFHISGTYANQICEPLENVAWAYVSERGHWMVIAREGAGGNWNWDLYAISPQRARKVKSATLPADVITVNWAPDESKIAGLAGEKLWTIDIPSLQAKPIGSRTDWNADDATWIGKENALVVATQGELWRVDVKTAQAKKIWRFPKEFWE